VMMDADYKHKGVDRCIEAACLGIFFIRL